jgi:hypothetical protein
MGKRHVHVIVVRKRATLVLLVLVSAAMIALLLFLSGRAYAGQGDPLRAVFTRSFTRAALLASLMPVIGNILLFVPWGFLTFVALDAPSRPRVRSYVTTVLAALIFAALMHIWQQFLPTRVVTVTDSAANVLGALAGALLGHMRKGLHVRFDF